MYALIVDGFSSSEDGRKKFNAFNNLIRLKLKETGEKTAIQIKKLSSLENYLFLPDEGYRNNNGAYNFDKIDLLFIDGEEHLLPWEPQQEQIRILLKMCLLTNKCVFACSFAMQIIAYICSSGGPKLHIVEKLYAGGTINLLKSRRVDHPSIVHDNNFIDNYTGDIYRFDKDAVVYGQKGVWVPTMNAGIRMRRAMGKLKRNVYRVDPINVEYYDPNKEASCRVDSLYIQHWLFQDTLKQQFIVGALNTWDVIRPTVAGFNKGSFTTLAESLQAPLVIESGNIIGVQYHLDDRYPETIPLIGNFVRHMFSQMQELGTICLSASSLRSELSVLTADKKLGYSLSNFADKPKSNDTYHVNISVARGLIQSVDGPINAKTTTNNFSSALALAIRPSTDHSKFTRSFFTENDLTQNITQNVNKENTYDYSEEFDQQNTSRSFYSPEITSLNASPRKFNEGRKFLSESLSKLPYDPAQDIDWSQFASEKSIIKPVGFTKKEIRNYLHPVKVDSKDEHETENDEVEIADNTPHLEFEEDNWAVGLETRPAPYEKHIITRNEKPYCGYNNFKKLAKDWENKTWYEKNGMSEIDIAMMKLTKKATLDMGARSRANTAKSNSSMNYSLHATARKN